jgi:transglutaminase-like putative cysteine protease
MPSVVQAKLKGMNQAMRRHCFAGLGVLSLLIVSVLQLYVACAAYGTFKLETPASGVIRVDSEFRLSGACDYDELLISLWRKEAVYTTQYAQQRVEVRAGKFDTWIWLPWGSGEYTVRLWGGERDASFYTQLAVFQVTAVMDTMPTQALPVMLHAFDPATDSILQPARAYEKVAGQVPLRFRTEHAHLMLELYKDGSIEQYLLPAAPGEIRTDLWLARGAGRYDLVFWAPMESEGSYMSWASFAVENLNDENLEQLPQSLLWYNAAWQGDKSMLQIDNPEALYGGISGISSGLVQLTGRTGYDYLSATVVKDGVSAQYRIPVQDGRFTADLWLRFGPGIYSITFWADVTGKGELQGLVSFAARSAAPDTLLYLAPSWGIECDHPTIVQLAKEITRASTNDMQRILAIHDWVVEHISYDVDKYLNNSYHPNDGALRTLQLRQGVCQDYTYLTVALLRAIGIPARRAIGQSYSRGVWGDHAWTEAYADGRWVVLDTTWNAGYMTDTNRFVKRTSHQYFDPPTADFARDHVLAYYDY